MIYKIPLLELPHTDKILLETPISAGLGFGAGESFVARFDGTDEIIHILSDEDFEDESSSLFEENIGNIEDGEVELDGSILIDSLMTGGGRSNIGCYTVCLYNPMSFQKFNNRLCNKHVSLKYMDIWISKSHDFLDIDPHDDPCRTDLFCQNLEPTPRRTRDIDDGHPRLDDRICFLNLEEFESTSRPVPEALRFIKILITNDVWSFT